MKVRRAVMPVAGFGTRFLPVTKSQPKEMLPVVDKPVIHYLVEEAVKSGIEEIIIVTGRGKRAIEDYFDQSFELEHNLVEKGKEDLLKEVLEIPNMARFVYVRQAVPRGDGDAILCAFDLVREEPFAVIFGDNLVMNDESPGLSQLISMYERTGESVIGLNSVSDKEVSMYGMVDMDSQGLVQGFVEKPASRAESPSNLAVVGKYIVTPSLLQALKAYAEGHSGTGEIRLANGIIDYIAGGGKVYGHEIEGKHYDTGNKVGWLKANIDYAMARGGELEEEIRGWMG